MPANKAMVIAGRDILMRMSRSICGIWGAGKLWGTWPKLPDALEVMRAWGFEYVTGFPWVKVTPDAGTIYTGIGFWTQSASEFIFIGRRGKGLDRDGGAPVVGLATDARGADEHGRPRVGCGRVLPRGLVGECGEVSGMGGARIVCEDCASGTSGNKNNRVLWAPRAEHSRKPEAVHEWVERLFPEETAETRLELFARRARAGWSCWGGDLGFMLGPKGVRRVKVKKAASEQEGMPWTT